MYYGKEFMPPRQLGRINAESLRMELVMDNLGMCRFHRLWAEDMLPDIVGSLFGLKSQFLDSVSMTASRINSRNASIFWEPGRNADPVHTFLRRKRDEEGDTNPELATWIDGFETDRDEAALNFWCEMHKGTLESLREF